MATAAWRWTRTISLLSRGPAQNARAVLARAAIASILARTRVSWCGVETGGQASLHVSRLGCGSPHPGTPWSVLCAHSALSQGMKLFAGRSRIGSPVDFLTLGELPNRKVKRRAFVSQGVVNHDLIHLSCCAVSFYGHPRSSLHPSKSGRSPTLDGLLQRIDDGISGVQQLPQNFMRKIRFE